MTHQFNSTVLREYDIRGIIGETLGPDDARAIGRGFGTLLRRAGGKLVAVGYDGRHSSPMLEHALVEALAASGCDVRRIGHWGTGDLEISISDPPSLEQAKPLIAMAYEGGRRAG